MCLLSVFPSKVQPNMDDLEEGTNTNTDGFGYAIAVPEERRIIRFRSMDAAIALSRFEADRRDYPDGPALFHSRWGTMGERSKFNVHPFRVGTHPDAIDIATDSKTVLAHNGVIYSRINSKDDYLKRMSDTRFFAEVIFPTRYRRLDRPGVIQQFEAFLGRSNKMAVLTVNPRYKQNLYILNESLGHWTNGVWHSNYGYRKIITTDKWWNHNSRSTWAGYECDFCGEASVYYGICTHCQSCNWCGEEADYCECLSDGKGGKTLTNESRWARALDKDSRPVTCQWCRYSINYCQCATPCDLYPVTNAQTPDFQQWCRTHHVAAGIGATACRGYRSSATALARIES